MSSDVFIQVQRAGIQMYARILMQKDNASVQEEAYNQGDSPYERYDFYALGNWTILQRDLLIDLVNIDPITQTNTQYRVINSPENFPDSHCEIVADLVRGT